VHQAPDTEGEAVEERNRQGREDREHGPAEGAPKPERTRRAIAAGTGGGTSGSQAALMKVVVMVVSQAISPG